MESKKITISDEDFRKFREYFYRKTGIIFELSKRYFVDKRLIERIVASDKKSFSSYFSMLRMEASGEELQQLTNSMTVNETYFLREEYQFECLVNSILPEIVKRKTDKNPIRIWCIPSSSGEEAYTVAMYLIERWAGLEEWNVEIISSDIDTGILHKAQVGRYSPRSVQHVPAVWLSKYFTRIGDGQNDCRAHLADARCIFPGAFLAHLEILALPFHRHVGFANAVPVRINWVAMANLWTSVGPS